MNQLTRRETEFKQSILRRVNGGLGNMVEPGEQVLTTLYALSPPSPHWHWIFHFVLVQALRTAFVVCLTNRRLLIFKSSKTLWGAGTIRKRLFEYDVGSVQLTDKDKGKSVFLGPWRMVCLNTPALPPFHLIILEKLWGGEAGVLMQAHAPA